MQAAHGSESQVQRERVGLTCWPAKGLRLSQRSPGLSWYRVRKVREYWDTVLSQVTLSVTGMYWVHSWLELNPGDPACTQICQHISRPRKQGGSTE